jgi:hypothetical protein
MQTTPKPVKWAAALLLAQAALMLIGGCIVMAITSQMIQSGNVPGGGTRFSGAQDAFIGFSLALAIAYCVVPPFVLSLGLVGVGLLRRWRWARMAAIFVSAINALVTIPLGTVVGIAVIVLLNRPEAKAAFSAAPPSSVVPTMS